MKTFLIRNVVLILLIVLILPRDAYKNTTDQGSHLWWAKAAENSAKQLPIFGYSVAPEAMMDSESIISFRGYPVRTYSVTTEDGYILELRRIPYGKNSRNNYLFGLIPRQVVFLQHGILCTDATWILLPSDVALAFVLADLGYDVWLGNARGNTYSRKHTYLDPSKQEYWKFSVDEMGKYDIPAMINFVLTTTGQNSLSYIGYSMGSTMFFIGMTYHPELNNKVNVMIALAPATANGNTQNVIRYQAPYFNQIVRFYEAAGMTVFQPVDSPRQNLQKMYCGPNRFLRESFCKNYLFRLSGDDYYDIDANFFPVIDGHVPAGTSIRTIAFYAQNYNDRQTFQAYDFGPAGNQARYGQPTPLVYDLSKVTCPVYLFWGANDKVVDPADVAWLAGRLGNLKKSIQVEDPNWNHGSYVLASSARKLVYDRLIPLIPTLFNFTYY